MRVRIFQSALVNVTYAAGRPLTLSEYLALPAKRRNELHAKVQS